MSDRRSPARGARRFDFRGRRPTRVAGGLLGLGLILAVAVAASWRLSAPEPTGPPVSLPPDSEPTQFESVAPRQAASGTPAPVAGPIDFMPLCTGATSPGRALSVVPPVAGDVTFELVSQVGGPATAATIGDGYLYSAVGAGVTVLDLRDPRRPSAIGATDALAAAVEDVSFGDRLLGVAIGEAGLALLETSDPTNPELLGSVPLPGYAEALALTDRYAFVADGPGGLRVVDVTDPQRATEIGVALEEHQAIGIAVTASHAYIAAGDEGLLVVDITDPVVPRQIGSLFTGGYAYGVAVSGDTAFLADGWGGLRLIDVHDPAQPRLLSTVDTRLWALDVAAEGEWAYVASGSEGLLVVDVRILLQPEVVGTLPLPDGRATHVVARKGLAYLTDALAGIHVVDVTEPKRPTNLQTQDVLADAWDAKVVGGHAFVAGGPQGLRVLDVSDPMRPVEVAGVRTEIFLQDVAIVDDNVFASGGGGESGAENAIVGFDVSDATRPAHGDSYFLATPDFSGFSPGSRPAAQGASLYYPIEAGLLIVDGTSVAPCEIGHLQTQAVVELEQGYLGGVSVAGDVVYLAALADGIFVVDASAPSRPVFVRGVDAGANVIHVLAAGPTLYAVDGRALVAFSLEDPRDPQRLGAMELPFDSTGLAYADGHLFVASQSALLAVDVSEPAEPRIAGRVDLPGVIARLTVTDRYVYVSLGAVGLSIVRWGPGPQARSAPAGLRRQHLIGAAGVSLYRLEPAVGQTRTGSPPKGIPASGSGLPLPAIPSPTSECRVTTAADDGPGSLRNCIGGAASATRISFDAVAFPITTPGIIRPDADLPEVPPGVTIDGTGAGVILDGQGQISVGLQLSGRDAVIGLHIRNFTNTGLAVGTGSRVSGNVLSGNGYSGIDIAGSENRVTGNRIGTDPTGSKTGGFQPHGVLCQGNDNVIGGSAAADANVIAGNQTDVSVLGTGNLLIGNLIGTDATGTRVVRGAVPDDPDIGALKVRTAGHVLTGNVIAGFVEFGDWAVFNSFVGNLVGVDRTGRALDCECGVRVDTPFNRIGGALPGEGNIIRGHLGIFTTDTVVLGNKLIGVSGVVADLATAIGLADGARHNVIGGRSERAPNVMTGAEGVHIGEGAAHNVIIRNRISVTGDGIGRSGSRTNYVVANVIARS